MQVTPTIDCALRPKKASLMRNRHSNAILQRGDATCVSGNDAMMLNSAILSLSAPILKLLMGGWTESKIVDINTVQLRVNVNAYCTNLRKQLNCPLVV